jgi:hypothetical protein
VSGPPGAPGWGQPAAPKKRSGLKIGLIIGGVLALLLCGCLVGVSVWLFRLAENNTSDPTPVSAPSARATAAAPSASPSVDDDGNFAKGDCVVNEGTADDAKLRKVPCGPDTYEVLSKIPFTTDADKCESDPIFGDRNTTTTYRHDDPSGDFGDYVLCMKER